MKEMKHFKAFYFSTGEGIQFHDGSELALRSHQGEILVMVSGPLGGYAGSWTMRAQDIKPLIEYLQEMEIEIREYQQSLRGAESKE